jgi:glutamate carboxypeptidase
MLKEYMIDHIEEIIDLIQALVEFESPSSDKHANDLLGQFIANLLTDIGMEVSFDKQSTTGNHVIARWSMSGESSNQILLLCHMDTVWPINTIYERPLTRGEKVLKGPGVFDMKGGLACTVFALIALKRLNLEPRHPITLIVNSDEELGSPTSRALIDFEARNSQYCLVMEAGMGPQGKIKTSRKGVGSFEIQVQGSAAHASLAPVRGVNAIEELIFLLGKVLDAADIANGTTVNIGMIDGGIARNVVAPYSKAAIDVRASTKEEANRITNAILTLKPRNSEALVSVTGGITRQPMELSEKGKILFSQVQKIAFNELGVNLEQGSSGGGSDGQIASAAGCPTLDGMGVIGYGAHSENEAVLIRSLSARSALIATILVNV